MAPKPQPLPLSKSEQQHAQRLQTAGDWGARMRLRWDEYFAAKRRGENPNPPEYK